MNMQHQPLSSTVMLIQAEEEDDRQSRGIPQLPLKNKTCAIYLITGTAVTGVLVIFAYVIILNSLPGRVNEEKDWEKWKNKDHLPTLFIIPMWTISILNGGFIFAG